MYWDWQNESNFMVSSTSTHGAAALYSSLNRWSMGCFIDFSKTNNTKRGIHRDYILLIFLIAVWKYNVQGTSPDHYKQALHKIWFIRWKMIHIQIYILFVRICFEVTSNRNHLRSIEISNFQNMVKRKYMTSFLVNIKAFCMQCRE